MSFEYRFAEGNADGLAKLAAELVQLRVDVILADSTAATNAARNATHTVPIVMAAVVDPVATGFVASLSRPGGNITGLSVLAPELAGKRLQLLTETVPGLSARGRFSEPVIAGPQSCLSKRRLRRKRLASCFMSRRHQRRKSSRPHSPRSQRQAPVRYSSCRTHCCLTNIPASWHLRRRPAYLRFLLRNRSWNPADMALMAYGASIPASFRRAAVYVVKYTAALAPPICRLRPRQHSSSRSILKHELNSFSEEYRHELHILRIAIGRIEHVVYALARSWGVDVNRTTLKVLSGLDSSFEQLS